MHSVGGVLSRVSLSHAVCFVFHHASVALLKRFRVVEYLGLACERCGLMDTVQVAGCTVGEPSGLRFRRFRLRFTGCAVVAVWYVVSRAWSASCAGETRHFILGAAPVGVLLWLKWHSVLLSVAMRHGCQHCSGVPGVLVRGPPSYVPRIEAGSLDR